MDLRYLDFDFSEDTEGIGTFDAMASVAPDRVSQVEAEARLVLAWAFDAFPDGHGPLAEGFEWDHDLQSNQEPATVAGAGESQRLHTITLSLSGGPDFCRAFRDRFDPAL